MEIDLDNRSSAARMKRKSATRSVWKKRTKSPRSLPTTTAATPAKSDCQTGQQAGFDAHTFRWVKPFQRIQQRLRRLRQRQMSGMDRADALLNRRIAERDADGAQRCHLRFTAPAPRCPVPLATILPTVTS